jgi:glyoxylase-like metal-dependent hydrolase (beta-lactamase superfamily II)
VAKPIVEGVTTIPMGGVNAYLIEGAEGLALVDTGISGKTPRIEEALRTGTRHPGDLANVLITHYHADHIGGLALIARRTGAIVHVHPLDAAIVRSGGRSPEVRARSLMAGVLKRMARSDRAAPATVDHELVPGEELPIAGGIRAIHTPGHTPGHTSFLWTSRGILFAGDAAGNLLGRLGPSVVDEDPAQADRTFSRLADLEFEVALFGHGKPVVGSAARRFREVAARRGA